MGEIVEQRDRRRVGDRLGGGGRDQQFAGESGADPWAAAQAAGEVDGMSAASVAGEKAGSIDMEASDRPMASAVAALIQSVMRPALPQKPAIL